MVYKLLLPQFIQIKIINNLGRKNEIFRQYYIAQFSGKLKFSTNNSTTSKLPLDTGNLGLFLSQYQSFKPLTERNNLGILIDLEDYKQKKKLLKESLKKLEDELESYDNKSLLGILLYCLEMSDNCLNDSFNLKLLELLISRSQSNQSIHSNSIDYTLTGLNNVFGLDYSFISKILDDHVHLVYLLTAFLKFKLHSNLEKHFDYFYISLNRNIDNYSSKHLVELCRTLGSLYLLTNIGGIKILLQKCVYSLLEQIDKYNVDVPVYSWIHLIKSINKCDENHLFKKLDPYITATLQTSPFNTITRTSTSNYYYNFDPTTDTCKISEEETRKYYKFIKLNIHLLNTLLMAGIIENINLFESIFQMISNYLLFYTTKTSKTKSFNSISYLTNTKSNNEYNKPNELVDELLYKKYSNKLFKSPTYNPQKSNLSSYENTEENLIQYGLLNLLNNGKVTFVRGLKFSEMYMRTLYPSLYSILSKNSLLKVTKQLPFDNEKEYIYVTNIMNDNMELIKRYVDEQDTPMIVLVDIYYLICTNYNKKIYIEVIDRNDDNSNRMDDDINDESDNSNRNNYNSDSSNKSNKYDKDNSNNNDMSNTNNNNYDNNSQTTDKPIKLSKQMEFKQQYLKSLGWTCVQIYKS